MSKSTPISFKYTSQHKTPPLPKLRTEWDLSIYYKNNPQTQIEKEVVAIEKAYATFAKKYSDQKYLRSAAALSNAFADYFALDTLRPEKALRYYFFRKELDSGDREADRKSNQLQLRLTKAMNQILFFPLSLIQLPAEKLEVYQNSKVLAPYHYYLSRLALQQPHTLTEPEERIIRQKALPAHSLWISAVDTILGAQTVRWKNEDVSLLSAIEQMPALHIKERPKLWGLITTELKKTGAIAEHELTALVIDKSINDELRKYQKPYASTIIAYQNEPLSVENLVNTVSKKGFSASRKYYTEKAIAHKLSQLTYTDRYRTLGKLPTISFTQASEILRDVLYGFRTEYGELFDSLLKNGHIDVYPKRRKQGGAFMASGVNEPIMIFLNHTDTFTTLETLAHEVGHAIHSHCSQKNQPAWYQEYSTVTAETASTFFEQLLFDAVYEQADADTKTILLEHKLDRATATIMRQIAFFNFEVSMHEHIRAHGAADSQTLAKLLQQHIQSYMGKRVTISESDGYSYVYVGHFRRSFYVYTYAYGHLMSSLMLQKYYRDTSYAESVHTFLSAGASATVEDIYRSIDIEPTDVAVMESALTQYEQDVKMFKKLHQ